MMQAVGKMEITLQSVSAGLVQKTHIACRITNFYGVQCWSFGWCYDNWQVLNKTRKSCLLLQNRLPLQYCSTITMSLLLVKKISADQRVIPLNSQLCNKLTETFSLIWWHIIIREKTDCHQKMKCGYLVPPKVWRTFFFYCSPRLIPIRESMSGGVWLIQ